MGASGSSQRQGHHRVASHPPANNGYPGQQPRGGAPIPNSGANYPAAPANQQQARPAAVTNYPANMRQPLNPNLFPTAAPAPIPPQFAFNSVGPRNNLKEGEKITQVATVDAKSVVYHTDTCLLTFTVYSNGPCSYEVHTGIRERLDPSGRVIFTPNRMKKAPTAYMIDKALPEGEQMLALLEDEIPQMNVAELTFNPKFPKYYPCVVVLRWRDAEKGTDVAEHTFINLGPRGPSPSTEGARPKGKESPGYVHKQLLEANGSIFVVESLFGAADDIVVATVADGQVKSGEGGDEAAGVPADGNVNPANNNDDDDDNGLCVICISEPKDTCVIPCRHLCLCKDCAQELQKHSPKCPVCREPIQQLLHLKG